MRVLIAPDKFKGSVSAREAAEAIREGLGPDVSPVCLPIADGGEGTAEALCDALGGKWITCPASDPLGRVVEAGYALADGAAILEMSQASGLWRLTEKERDPWVASTYGTGELIRDAVERGAQRILLGLGGSATNDGGSGMALALGVRFLDSADREILEVPSKLTQAVRIDSTRMLDLPKVEVACDVSNPLLGEKGATRVYGGQKGVSANQIEWHEERLEHLAGLAGSEFRDVPGAGAAGGLGFGCMAFCGAKLQPGFDLVADLLNLEAAISQVDAVITGEGSLDAQTLQGKGPHGIAILARKLGKPVLALAGRTDGSPALAGAFDRIQVISPPDLPVEEAMRRGPEFLAKAAAEAMPWLSSQLRG